MSERNRAEGWKHAKLSGHENEDKVKELLDTDEQYARKFLLRINSSYKELARTSIGGLHEKNVEGVLGKKTKSKTDLKLHFIDDSICNISIKKSLGGQVYFVKANNFIEVFEKQFLEPVPADVQRAIKLFWKASSDAVSIIEKFSDRDNVKVYDMQIRHKSLNASTLSHYDKNLYDNLLQWFKNNIYNVTRLCFATGAVKNQKEWADFVWYKNMLGENNVDAVFKIEDICNATVNVVDKEIYYGISNGGTTIQLPFGFVQWHQGQLQFHHDYYKILALLKNE